MTARLHKTIDLQEIDEKVKFETLSYKLTQYSELKDEIEELKTELINKYGECKRYGINIMALERKGSIDLKALCQEFDISEEEAEEFRKKPVSYWKVTKY